MKIVPPCSETSVKHSLQLYKNFPEFNIWDLSLGLATSAHATIQCAIELRDADLRKDLANIQIPTLILHGINDCVCLLDLAKVMHEDIKGSQLVQIEKAGHGFYFEEHERVKSELVKFIV
jgi:non-heme chloroperoxidase